MRARDFITELFDKPYALTWDSDPSFGDVEAYAAVGDYGDHLTILFEKGFAPDGTPSWAVEFSRNESQKKTGEGDSQRIFATVLTAIQIFIKKYEPLKIFFAARKETDLAGQDSQSRIRLYDSLVQRYANAWGYTNNKIDQDKRVIYELTKTAGKSKENSAKIKQGVAEGGRR